MTQGILSVIKLEDLSFLSRSSYHDERVHEVDRKDMDGSNSMPGNPGIAQEDKNSSLSS